MTARPAAAVKPNTGNGAPGYVAKMQGLRRSGAAGTHAPRATRRIRTRAAARNRAVRRDQEMG